MKYVHRLLEARISRDVRTYGAVVVTGPRQAGKSTLLGHTFRFFLSGSLHPRVWNLPLGMLLGCG